MKLLIVLTAAFLATNALSETSQWSHFKVNHSKNYQNIVEEKLRYDIFKTNLKTIEEHNARYEQGLETYTLGVNQFADMTPEEFSDMLNLQVQNRPALNQTLHEFPENLEAPDAIDWRSKGAVFGVKDQGSCGSCWAFSATGALEGQNFIKHGKKITLSEQQLMDCSSSYGNGDCVVGGEMTFAFNYVKDNGIESDHDYPYKGRIGTCQASASKSVLKVSGYKSVAQTEAALKNAVGTIGPISVAIYAEPIQFYSSGIFTSSCSNSAAYLDHGVLAVGYGTENGKDYWIIKNSWGASWGEKGYFRLQRNANKCGIALDTCYPTF